MGVFEMVVAIVLISTAGRVVQSFAARGARKADAAMEDRVRKLEGELRASELRLAQTEERVAELDEKLGFVENLLAKPAEPPRLPS